MYSYLKKIFSKYKIENISLKWFSRYLKYLKNEKFTILEIVFEKFNLENKIDLLDILQWKLKIIYYHHGIQPTLHTNLLDSGVQFLNVECNWISENNLKKV